MDTSSAWKTYFALLFGTFVTIEAAAFQVPALPTVAQHFGIPVTLAAVILLLYFIGLTVFAPIMGRLADSVGRKRILMLGLGVFATAEFLAALAPNFTVFLAARLLQGFGVACILPGVLAYVGHLFPENKRGSALGLLTMAMTIGAALGGLLGGLLIDSFGWPSVYWISGVLAMAGLLPVAILVPEVKSSTLRKPFDVAGAVCLFITITALLSFPTWIGQFGLGSTYALTALGIGALGLTVLWRIGNRAAAPVVDLSILRQRSFSLPAAIYWLQMLCSSGLVYSVAFFVSGRPGGSASQVGLATLFLYCGSMVAAPISGRLIDRVSTRSVIIAALCLFLASLGMLVTIRVETPLWFILMTLALIGIIMGTIGPAIMKTAIGAVPPEKLGAGTGMFSMLRDLGNPAGSAFALGVFGSTLAAKTHSAIQVKAQALGIGEEFSKALATAVDSKGKIVAPALLEKMQALGVELGDLLQSAGADGLSAALPSVGWLLIAMVIFTLVLSLFLEKDKDSQSRNALGRVMQ